MTKTYLVTKVSGEKVPSHGKNLNIRFIVQGLDDATIEEVKVKLKLTGQNCQTDRAPDAHTAGIRFLAPLGKKIWSR